MSKRTDKYFKTFAANVENSLTQGYKKYGNNYITLSQRQFIEEKVRRVHTLGLDKALEDLEEIAAYAFLWWNKLSNSYTRPPVGVLYSLTGETARSLHDYNLITGQVKIEHPKDFEYAVKMFDEWGVKHVISIGCMLKIPTWFHRRYPTYNLHPGLLPKYAGKDPHLLALKDRPCMTAVTIHKVTDEIDSGEMLGQIPVSVDKKDTEHTLYTRLKQVGLILTEQFIRSL